MIIMVYNTGKGKSPRNQQRSNPRGGPAGSGVPGQNGKNKRRKWTGFTQKTFADGRTKGFSTFKMFQKVLKKLLVQDIKADNVVQVELVAL